MTFSGTESSYPRPPPVVETLSFQKYTIELYGGPSASLKLKIRMLTAEALETMLYGCVT